MRTRVVRGRGNSYRFCLDVTIPPPSAHCTRDSDTAHPLDVTDGMKASRSSPLVTNLYLEHVS
jgi:hypothetical protein